MPMPLADARLRERGFNQALVNCAASWHRPRPMPRVLLRLRDTLPQTTLSRAERLANLRHAFAVDPLRTAAVAGGGWCWSTM
jgi:predicted amidophosphoribosyltransferase